MSKKYKDVCMSHTGYEDAIKRASMKYNLDGSESHVEIEKDGINLINFKLSINYSNFDSNFIERDKRYHDHSFNWKIHQKILDKIFFNEDSFIIRASEEYEDFWKFSENYFRFQKNRLNKKKFIIILYIQIIIITNII